MNSKTSELNSESIHTILVLCLRILLICTLFMPLIVTTSTYFPFVVGKAIFSRILIEFAIILWVPVVILSKDYRPRKSPVFIALSIYILIATISSIFGVSLNVSFWSTYERMQGLIDLTHWLAFSIMITSVFRTANDWIWALSFNLGVSILVSIIGLGQYFGIESLMSIIGIISQSTRIESSLGNATYVGAYCTINILISGALMCWAFGINNVKDSSFKAKGGRQSRDRRKNTGTNQRYPNFNKSFSYWILFYLVAIAVNTYTLALSGTRGALLGLGIASIYICVYYTFAGKYRTLRPICLSILIFMLIAAGVFMGFKEQSIVKKVSQTNPITQRVAQFNLSDESLISRWHTWKAGISATKERPILGWGPENFIIAWAKYFDHTSGVKERFDQAHNKLIEEATTKGVLGLLSYLSIWATIGLTIRKYLKNTNAAQQGFLLFISAALLAYFVQNLFLFDTLTTYLEFIILLSLVAALSPYFWESKTSDPNNSKNTKTQTFLNGTLRLPIKVSPNTITYSLLIVLIPAILSAVFWLNIRPFSASQHTMHILLENYRWEDRMEFYEKAIELSPGLSNYTHILFLKSALSDWDNMPAETKQSVKTIVENETVKGLLLEPHNWRLYYSLARFYQIATLTDLSLLPRADHYTDMTSKLAPNTLEANIIRDVNSQLHDLIDKSQTPGK